MNFFTTFFDKNYLSRGIALIESLKIHCGPHHIFVLCLDKYTFSHLNNLNSPNITPILLHELEAFYPELLPCKNDRKLIEYYFTLSPYLPLFILEKFKTPHICSLDADILFLSNPTPLFEHLHNFSIIITPHKFSSDLKSSEKFGLFNVSFQIFKNNTIGIQCLKKWKIECTNWCKDHLDSENERFADQKYLDSWPVVFENSVKVLDDDVSGLAVWNINNYTLDFKNGQYLSNNLPIIFYHFHNFKLLNNSIAGNGFCTYKVKKQKWLDKLYSSSKRKREVMKNKILVLYKQYKNKYKVMVRRVHLRFISTRNIRCIYNPQST